MSSPAKATSRGPDCPVGTPGSSVAHVVSPQHGHATDGLLPSTAHPA